MPKSFEEEISKGDGRFRRTESMFRNRISKGGRYPPEANRYHLYVCHACPWAHRTQIVLRLKGLHQGVIGTSVVHWLLDNSVGWAFRPDEPESQYADKLHPQNGSLRALYEQAWKNAGNADTAYPGKTTVPVLWDSHTSTIVNNESSEIIRMLNSEFDDLLIAENVTCQKNNNNNSTSDKSVAADKLVDDLYPPELRSEIDEVNEWIYNDINNGVYKSGFATSQEGHEEAFDTLFAALDRVEERLARSKYLCSDTRLTLADVRLFTTLVRFDPVYHNHFRCNRNKLIEMPHTWNYLCRLYASHPAFRDTTHLFDIKHHYYVSHKAINPTGVVPKGPGKDDNDYARLLLDTGNKLQ